MPILFPFFGLAILSGVVPGLTISIAPMGHTLAHMPHPTQPTEHEHSWGEWFVTKPANTDEDGEETRECIDDDSHYENRPIAKIATITYSKSKFTYNGKTQRPTVEVYDANGKKLSEGTAYTVQYPTSSKNAGLYVMSVIFQGKYEGIDDHEFSITKAKNPITAKGLSKSVKLATVKKKNVSVAAVNVTKAQGTKTFKKLSGNAKITVNKTTGKLTVKKGLKKGTYKVKVRVTAKGNKNYKSGYKDVTVTIKVK